MMPHPWPASAGRPRYIVPENKLALPGLGAEGRACLRAR